MAAAKKPGKKVVSTAAKPALKSTAGKTAKKTTASPYGAKTQLVQTEVMVFTLLSAIFLLLVIVKYI
jgi:hypothetical protein